MYVAALIIEGAGVSFVFQPGTRPQTATTPEAHFKTALVALQALNKPEDRAVVTSTRNMLRALGSSIGVAVSTAIQYGIMKLSLLHALPQDLRSQVLNGEWSIERFGSSPWAKSILDAKMKGAHIVLITFVPLLGLCLPGCLLFKDKIILLGDDKLKSEKKESGTSVSKV